MIIPSNVSSLLPPPVFDATASSGSASTSGLSFTHTLNKTGIVLLFVIVDASTVVQPPTYATVSASCGGVSMTALASNLQGNGYGSFRGWLFSLSNVSAGAKTIAVSNNYNPIELFAISTSYSGATSLGTVSYAATSGGISTPGPTTGKLVYAAGGYVGSAGSLPGLSTTDSSYTSRKFTNTNMQNAYGNYATLEVCDAPGIASTMNWSSGYGAYVSVPILP